MNGDILVSVRIPGVGVTVCMHHFLESMGGILPDVHGYMIGTSERADSVLVTLTPFPMSQEAYSAKFPVSASVSA